MLRLPKVTAAAVEEVAEHSEEQEETPEQARTREKKDGHKICEPES